jgi:hypothetical protein
MDEDCYQRPQSFAETVVLVENYVLEEIKRETQRKQLYYHTVEHAFAVKRRAKTIFKSIDTHSLAHREEIDIYRLEGSIDICAIAHDMIQEFKPSLPGISRKRHFGIGETATIDKLIEYLESLNRQFLADNLDRDVMFTDEDLQIIRESIAATACSYDLNNNSIYQPYLYQTQSSSSLVPKIIALADLGTLGMDGIKAYLQDSILLFAEDNPDLAHFILNRQPLTASRLSKHDWQLKLAEMTDSIVKFARERYWRFEIEISSFSQRDRTILRDRVFPYLTTETIEQIENLMPRDYNFNPVELLNLFTIHY